MSAISATSTQGASLPPEAKRCRSAPEDDASACAPTASTFTERCANDSVTLSLVLGCLDVYSILRARRVCRAWQAATRAPLTWSHCALAVHAQHVARIPVSSVALLRHLTVAFSCRCERDRMQTLAQMSPNQQGIFEWAGQLRGLRSLYVRGVVVDTELCNMLSVHAAGIRELDLTMCDEGEEGNPVDDSLSDGENSRQYQATQRNLRVVQLMGPLDSSVANNDAHDAQDGLLSAAATSASRDVKDAMVHMRLPPAADDRPLPTLHLPQLTSLKLFNSSSYRNILTLIAPLHRLQSLQLRRSGTCSIDMTVGERHYLALMNRLFAHTYADTLTHLTLSNLHAHGFESYRFELLHKLTHLSLKQRQRRGGGGITCATLRAVAVLPRLERCEIHVQDVAIGVCTDPEWWQALAGVRSLVALSVSGYFHPSETNTAMIVYLGLEHVICNSDIRLEKLQLRVLRLVYAERLLELNYPHVHTLVTFIEVCVASAASLARMPHLTSLCMIGLSYNPPGMMALLQALPKLRALKCSLAICGIGASFQNRLVNRDVWLALLNMPALTSLQIDNAWALQAMRNLGDDLVGLWCDAATSRPPPPDAMRAFMGGALPDRGSTLQLALQHLRFDSNAISPDQCRQLLRSMPQLQLLSVRHLSHYVMYPSCARLFVDTDCD